MPTVPLRNGCRPNYTKVTARATHGITYSEANIF